LQVFFADDGISGTNTKKRDEFNRMIDECMAGNIDMIITKIHQPIRPQHS
jgi:DNA invertase Pin-like site-specific DNA recombinase